PAVDTSIEPRPVRDPRAQRDLRRSPVRSNRFRPHRWIGLVRWCIRPDMRFNGTMRSFDIDDVLDGPPSWSTLIRRGLRRRCPRCGGGQVFENRWLLAERCPVCGLQFMREPGFRLGAWFLNYLFVAVLHMV